MSQLESTYGLALIDLSPKYIIQTVLERNNSPCLVSKHLSSKTNCGEQILSETERQYKLLTMGLIDNAKALSDSSGVLNKHKCVIIKLKFDVEMDSLLTHI